MGRKSCWKILGIEPTKDITEIKRAYAKLAHQVSPEDQPEEYQKIHEAYKQAAAYAKSSSAPVTIEVIGSAPQKEEKKEEAQGEAPPAPAESAPEAPAPPPASEYIY